MTGSGELKKIFPNMQTVIGPESKAKADIHVNHMDTLQFGKESIEIRSTPGHTNGTSKYVLFPLKSIENYSDLIF